MKKPPLNKFFKARAKWVSVSDDGDVTEHGPSDVVAIRYSADEYSFVHKGIRQYQHELGLTFSTFELI